MSLRDFMGMSPKTTQRFALHETLVLRSVAADGAYAITGTFWRMDSGRLVLARYQFTRTTKEADVPITPENALYELRREFLYGILFELPAQL